MKQIGSLTLAVLFSLIQIQAQTNKAKVDMAFDKTVDGITAHDYGSIIYGANGKVDFNFTNQGTKPLIITDVKSSCGCTIPTWTKEPVAPGQKGTIEVVYNTTLPGVFNKTVVVYSNANNSPVRLEIRGKVNSQPGDIKAGSPEKEKQNAIDRKLEEGNGGVKQAGGNAGDLNAAEDAASRKAKQRAAYEARVAKEKSDKAANSTTGAGTKSSAGTTTKKK
ncbi:MAG: DUF1573 domain-containing protein [Bacteroidia bacterium]|nr:DUF1573 domain-containing protein [Bacteroidia bacterium]